MALRSLVVSALLLVAAPLIAADKPNLLWLSTEDISPHLGCYGDPVAKTPALDDLATNGVLYNHAVVPAPVCAVCRSGMITGVYPISQGTHLMRSRVAMPPEIRPFTTYLRQAGYYCTNNSKTDYNFRYSRDAWDQSSGRAHWKNRPDADQPFFAVFNFVGTHESFIRGDQPKSRRQLATLPEELRTGPDEVTLPPYYPDTPAVREEYARNYNNIAVLDRWVAKHLDDLEEAGLADDTIVVFWSDHGIGMPRGKRWLYDSGVRIPLIVHVPEKLAHLAPPEGRAGVKTDRLVTTIDLSATMLSLAGVPLPAPMDGRPFFGANPAPPRDRLFGERDRMDARYDRMRSVTDGSYKLIANLMPWRPYAQYLTYGEVSVTMKTLRRLDAEGGLNAEQSLYMRPEKPLFELFDLDNDPHELNNLADDPAHAKTVARLHADLLKWQADAYDLGLWPESELIRLEEELGSRWAIRSRPGATETFAKIAKLSDFGDPSGGEAAFVTAMLDDPEPAVRFWAVARSGIIGEQADVVRGMLEDECDAVRVMAAEALIESGDVTTAMPTLLDVYASGSNHADGAAAAVVIDLVDDLGSYADELAAANQVVAEVVGKTSDNSPTSYLGRTLRRLQQRVAELN